MSFYVSNDKVQKGQKGYSSQTLEPFHEFFNHDVINL